MSIRVVAFDAYGTLFDVYSVAALLERHYPGQGATLAAVWLEKQMEYTRLISLSDPFTPSGSRFYQSFWDITQLALRYALAKQGLVNEQATERALMDAYGQLQAFAENKAVLIELKALGLNTAILSNGSPEMLNNAVSHAGLAPWIDRVLSVDGLRQYKTMPVTYAMVTEAFSVEPESVLFVSGNGWDIMGANWFGFETCWVNRGALPVETLGPPPDHEGSDLTAVLKAISRS
jgi:2-haloacid dehalogenase